MLPLLFRDLKKNYLGSGIGLFLLHLKHPFQPSFLQLGELLQPGYRLLVQKEQQSYSIALVEGFM